MEVIRSIFNSINDFISEFTALFSILLLIILFFVFDFKFLLRGVRMLRRLFKDSNLGFFTAFSFVWRIKRIDAEDKSARYKYLKAYCEYMIFASKGEKLMLKEWHTKSAKFFYEQVLDNPFCIKLDSSFDMITGGVDGLIKDYFEFLNANAKRYLHDKSNSKFVCNLSFENGFVYPASFINGLERKFEDSWTDLLVKYNYTLKNNKYHNSKESGSIIKGMGVYANQHFITSQNQNAFKLRSNELFMMYSWLMWSPSYQMTFDDDKYKIILYGIGDESNTTNLILDTSENSLALWEQLKKGMERKVYGSTLSIECELYELVPYLRKNLQNFSVETLPLISNLLNNSNDVHYILSYVAPTSDADLRNTNLIEDNDAFFSGYLWALFGRADQQHTRFDIKNSVVFFEHSNLADSTSVDYFTKSMAQKTILHFKDVLKDEEPCNYYLDFYVAESFKENYVALIEEGLKHEDKEFVDLFKKHVFLNENRATVNEILENIDEEFPLNEFEFKQVTKPEEIGNFYSTIYVNNFAPDERDSIDDLIYRTLKLKSENHHDIILATQNGELAGGIVFDYFKGCNCGLIEYVVVDNKYRGMRIAKKLVSKATAMMTHYAGSKGINAIFIEVEDPDKLVGLDAQAAVDNYKRLQLWSGNKYDKLDINYIQPALSSDLNMLDNLMLAVNTLRSNAKELDVKIVKKFLIDFNTICNRVEDVYDESVGVKQMLDELDSKPNGKVAILPNSICFEKYSPDLMKSKRKYLSNSISEVVDNDNNEQSRKNRRKAKKNNDKK